MKNYIYILLSILIANSCNTFKEKTSQKDFFSLDYKKLNTQNELIIIDLDSINNFSELRKGMEEIACENKVSGLKFNFNNTNYHITGFSECPESRSVACYFSRNTLMIKNDSIILDFKNKISIKNLKSEIDSIISKDYNYQHNKEILKPALIYLSIDEKYPISKTKLVLREIAEQFANVNSVNKPDYFQYNILFENEMFFIKPPPPPPPKDEN